MYGRPPMFNPRPYNPTISAPFRPNLITQPPSFIPQNIGFQQKFRPQIPIPHPIIQQNNNDIYLSVFIGEIPEGITDEFIEQILKVCGNVRSWKRIVDSQGKKMNFGICEFEGFEVLFRALRVIGGEANKELGKDENAGSLELPCDDDNFTMKHILFIIDNSTRSYITKNSKPRNPYDLEKDKECLKSIEEIVSKLVEEKKKKKEEEKAKNKDAVNKSDELLDKELSKIRDQVLHEEDYDRKRRRDDRDYDMMRKRDYDSPSSWRNEDIDEEEEERRRQERREKEMEQAYRERVKRWENREYERMKDYEMDQMDEAEYLERRKKDKEIYMERLANYDDDIERERAEHEYYYDRSRWWSHRKSYLSREAKEDDIDRRHEMEEIEEKRKKEIKLDYGSAENEPMPIIPRHTEEAKPKPKSEPEVVVGRIMTAEERKEAIEKLINSIPNEKEALWNWEIKWNFIDEVLLKEKVIPFVGKKIKEYFGEEEKELVDFIIDYIKKHKTAEQLYNELKPALDEEAEVFVMIIWRMLIFESESRKQGLS